MNQRAPFLCQELLPCPIPILQAAPAALFSWEGHRSCTVDMKGKGVKGERREGEDGQSLWRAAVQGTAVCQGGTACGADAE